MIKARDLIKKKTLSLYLCEAGNKKYDSPVLSNTCRRVASTLYNLRMFNKAEIYSDELTHEEFDLKVTKQKRLAKRLEREFLRGEKENAYLIIVHLENGKSTINEVKGCFYMNWLMAIKSFIESDATNFKETELKNGDGVYTFQIYPQQTCLELIDFKPLEVGSE